jgi:signal transduction histidine kinase
VRQIVSNLVSNAIKFTSTGAVRIEARTGDIEGEGVPLLVSVQDTGIGLDDDAQKSIFDGFSQVGAARRVGQDGAGRGLAVARGLAAAMGGEISCISAPGGGSTFTFCVRLARAAPSAMELEAPRAALAPAVPSAFWSRKTTRSISRF